MTDKLHYRTLVLLLPAILSSLFELATADEVRETKRRAATKQAAPDGKSSPATTGTKAPKAKANYSALMVWFYDDVARRVAVKQPQRRVCGLVYDNYMYPP